MSIYDDEVAMLVNIRDALLKKRDELESELVAWKAVAENMSEALKDLLMHNSPVPDTGGNPIPYQANPGLAQEALSAFQALKEKK